MQNLFEIADEVNLEASTRFEPTLFDALDTAELPFVRQQVAMLSIPAVKLCAWLLNYGSNGWMYPPIAVAALLLLPSQSGTTLFVALVSVAIAHALYPKIKTRMARLRPCERDAAIPSLMKPLDRYAFPSGHCMTSAAAFIPLAVCEPLLWPVAIAAVGLVGWARISAGHHYPTDVLAGTLLGALISGSLSFAIL
jgi:undecaprenyl-diphosphatase